VNHFVTVIIVTKTGAIAAAVVPRCVCGMVLRILDIMNDLVTSSVLICSLWYRYNLSALELHIADFDTISGLYFDIYLADIDFLRGRPKICLYACRT
jgi:hypothetical protein